MTAVACYFVAYYKSGHSLTEVGWTALV